MTAKARETEDGEKLSVNNQLVRTGEDVPVEFTEISVRGATLEAPAAQIDGRTVVVTGKWLKLAAFKDEEWQEGEAVLNPDQFFTKVRQHGGIRADIFTFSQKPNDPTPQFPFHYEWDSIAAIPVISFSDWWTKRVSYKLRQDVNRAAKRGVVVRPVPFADELVRGIVDIYNETPVRQGRAFWHYGKDFETVRSENATYLERSEFLGAFFGEELIGFLKIVYVDRLANLMQILSKDAHYDKRPTNALIAQAVKVCEEKSCSHLIYGNYRYPQGADSLTAFKRRNGFEEILVPRYYVPLTTKGSIALHLHLQKGVRALVPAPVLQSLRRIRAAIYRHSPAA